MNFMVYWSPASKDEYAEILKHLESEYGLESALKFMDKTDEVVNSISTFPKSGIPTKKEKIRKIVITKQTSLLYEINQQKIELLHFWDTRQNPEKLEDIS